MPKLGIGPGCQYIPLPYMGHYLRPERVASERAAENHSGIQPGIPGRRRPERAVPSGDHSGNISRERYGPYHPEISVAEIERAELV